MGGVTQKPRVLLVEEDPGGLMFTSTVLAQVGLSILEASSALHALHIASSVGEPLHLAIFDGALTLPGADFTEELLRLHPAVRIIHTTAAVASARPPAVAAVLEKPIERGALLKTVFHVLGEG